MIRAVIDAAPAAKQVLTAIRPISDVPVVVLPELNPNHPNHRMNTPNDASGIECPGIAVISFPLNLPILGPNIV